MMKIAPFVLAFMVASCSCSPTIQITPDTGPQTQETCGGACAVMAVFDCAESKPTARGVTCERLCLETPAYARLPVSCVVKAATREALQACGVCR